VNRGGDQRKFEIPEGITESGLTIRRGRRKKKDNGRVYDCIQRSAGKNKEENRVNFNRGKPRWLQEKKLRRTIRWEKKAGC